MHYFVFLTTSLFIFWLLMSGFWHNSLLLLLGILSSIFAAFIGSTIKRHNDLELDLGFCLRLPGYMIWLVGQVWLANVDTAKRIWMPNRYPVTPTIKKLRMSQRTNLGKTIYANSITITPGTVSIDIDDDQVIVHALSRASITELDQGHMDRKVTKLEPRK